MKKRTRTAPDMFTTSIALDRATYKQLGHLAVDEETTVRDLIRRAVLDYLHRRQKAGRPQQARDLSPFVGRWTGPPTRTAARSSARARLPRARRRREDRRRPAYLVNS